MHGVEGDVIASAVNGGIFVAVGGPHWTGQSLTVDTVNGDIGVEVPADCSAQVTARTSGGSISSDLPAEIVAQPGGASSSAIMLAATRGNISLRTED